MDSIPPPKRTVAECDEILLRPGSMFELEKKTINGVKLRVYKHLPLSIRTLWLTSAVSTSESVLVTKADVRILAESLRESRVLGVPRYVYLFPAVQRYKARR